ncbi:MAG: ATP-binding protein [Candidatus Limnocylindrales bacterium]|jgi:signal transduction histidine kinase
MIEVDLRAQIAALERESRQAFDEAQREADALFAQYQLSQLIASGGSPAELGAAVLVELTRLAAAARGALWLGAPDEPELRLIATTASIVIPTRHADLAAGRAWCAETPDCTGLVLGEEPPVTLLALWSTPDAPLDGEGLRIAQLSRHELVVAFRGARLRETLDRERTELSEIVEGATDLIMQVDADLRVVRLNAAGERLLDRSRADALGRTCAEVLSCREVVGHAEDACPFAAVIADGQPISYRETSIRGAGGLPVRVAGSYTRAAAEGSRGVRATSILRDISAQRALEELREGFVVTVSHELRTPLALVRGYAETLLHPKLSPPDQLRTIERILAVSERLTNLVNQILDVAYLNADPLVVERAPTSFGSLVAQLRGYLVLAGMDHRLINEAPADLPPLGVDAGRIGRVLENLVDNALKYAPPDSSVVIRAESVGDWLAVHVDDDGIGIPESERALVLEPFHRAWNVRESATPGTGLGLYICRRLIEAHGGQLRVEARPDGKPGTRVTFTLPFLRQRGTGASKAGEPLTGTIAHG